MNKKKNFRYFNLLCLWLLYPLLLVACGSEGSMAANPTTTTLVKDSPAGFTTPLASSRPTAPATRPGIVPATADSANETSLITTLAPTLPPLPPATLPASQLPAGLVGKPSKVGLNLYLYVQNEKVIEQTLTWLKDLQVRQVRLPLYWYWIERTKGQRDWSEVDRAVDLLHQAGIEIMLNAIHCPEWAAVDPKRPGIPRDAADFADFIKAAAVRYKGKVVAYEVWNEPNLEREAGKPINAGRYVELLKAGYAAIKSVDPAALVVTAGLTPTGVNNPQFAVDDVLYLRQFYAYNNGEAKKYFDVLGAHPGSAHNPPDTLWPVQPGPGPGWLDHPSFYFRRIEQIRQVMVENGDENKEVWLTEFGWASTPAPAPGFGYAAQVSEEQQGRYLGRALEKGQQEYKWLGRMFIFQLNMALPELTRDVGDERIAWGLVRRDGSKRPAYFAVQEFLSRK